jgi:general secretion pathway protein H
MRKSLAAVAGYTLIEILIVMLIISIVGGVTLLSVSINQNTRFKNLAQEITSLLTLGEEQALLQATVYGLAFTDKSFQFYQFDPTSKEQPWHPLNDKVLGLHNIPDGMQITVKVRDKIIHLVKDSGKLQPQLIISTSGDILPFTILIGKTDNPPRFQITGNANGSIESAAISS